MLPNAEAEIGESHMPYVAEKMRVLAVAGTSAGALIVGVGSRIAMFVLRITSPDSVRGVKSDDGFIIGEVTLGGTYNLLQLGAAVGIIGAAAYVLVAPWLIGPAWFRRLTTGLAAGAVAGSMLIHTGGVDFTVLQPTWLAIGLFIALPALFGGLIGWFVDSVGRLDSWTRNGTRRWLLPLGCVVCFPITLLILPVCLIGCVLWVRINDTGLVQWLRTIPAYSVVVRTAWLLVAAAGLVGLVSDITALT